MVWQLFPFLLVIYNNKIYKILSWTQSTIHLQLISSGTAAEDRACRQHVKGRLGRQVFQRRGERSDDLALTVSFGPLWDGEDNSCPHHQSWPSLLLGGSSDIDNSRLAGSCRDDPPDSGFSPLIHWLSEVWNKDLPDDGCSLLIHCPSEACGRGVSKCH